MKENWSWTDIFLASFYLLIWSSCCCFWNSRRCGNRNSLIVERWLDIQQLNARDVDVRLGKGLEEIRVNDSIESESDPPKKRERERRKPFDSRNQINKCRDFDVFSFWQSSVYVPPDRLWRGGFFDSFSIVGLQRTVNRWSNCSSLLTCPCIDVQVVPVSLARRWCPHKL